MERLREELEQWLPEQFPGAKVSLNSRQSGIKLSGILAWAGFDGLEPFERQNLVRQAIRTRFSAEDQRRISILIALSPAEYAVHREPQMV